MAKKYDNRAMETDAGNRTYFFPKANPPVAIVADSVEEAEAKLLSKKTKI